MHRLPEQNTQKTFTTAWAAGNLDKMDSENSKWYFRPNGVSDYSGLGSFIIEK